MLKRTFNPEFINRFDDLIVFHQLSKDDLKHIVDLEVAKLVERIKAGSLSLIALHSAHWSTPFVEAMNDSGPRDATNLRERPAMLQEHRRERAARLDDPRRHALGRRPSACRAGAAITTRGGRSR